MLYYNKMDITLTVLNGGNEIILANWSNHKHIICTINNDNLIEIPTNKTILEFTLPVFLNKSKFGDSLLSDPQTLKDYIAQYKHDKKFLI